MEKESYNKKITDKIYDELNEHKFFGIIITKAYNISSEKIKNKILDILKNLNSNKINIFSLNKIIFEGLPDDVPSLRSIIWKMLLGLIPLNVNDWEEILDKKRNDYNKLKKELYEKFELTKIKQNEKNQDQITSTKSKQKLQIQKNLLDHPLNNTENSKWKNYFNDQELFEEIEKDVRRTRSHMNFFFMPAKTNTTIISNDEITNFADKKRNEPGKEPDKKNFETNADVMTRILFIYGKKYPNIRYVQGMNEMLAPLFYCFSNDQNPYFFMNLEADSFLCFEYLMNEISDIFLRSKDNTPTGIQTKIKRLRELLRIVDRDVYNHLNENKLEIQFFVFRWLTLFFTQEFEMPDILRLWDSILSENDKFEFLYFLCLAVLKIKRSEILLSDFSEMMLCLQNLEKIDVEKFIKTAVDIKLDFNIRID